MNNATTIHLSCRSISATALAVALAIGATLPSAVHADASPAAETAVMSFDITLSGYAGSGTLTDFPFPAALYDAKPVLAYFEGWQCDISGVRRWDDLPRAARDYVTFIEEQLGCPIRYVSVGPERESIILR